MKVISHRGNLNGPNPSEENTVAQIRHALDAGFGVEVDVRGHGGELYLGHDTEQEKINVEYLCDSRLWVHAKNTEAVEIMSRWNLSSTEKIHWFWHQEDDMTITSEGRIWTYPGKNLVTGAIAVMPEISPGWDISNASGVCTDYPTRY